MKMNGSDHTGCGTDPAGRVHYVMWQMRQYLHVYVRQVQNGMNGSGASELYVLFLRSSSGSKKKALGEPLVSHHQVYRRTSMAAEATKTT